jgi:hypothetical protein
MDPLEILCQSPVLSALVAHLDPATARALFSSAKRLHTTLKSSAELRAAVWKLTIPSSVSASHEIKVGAMMGRVVAAGDLPALRVIRNDLMLYATSHRDHQAWPRVIKRRYYWAPLDQTLCAAALGGKFDIVDFLVSEGHAHIGDGLLIRAIRDGNVAFIEHVLEFYPAIGAQLESYLSVHDVNASTTLANTLSMDITINHELVFEEITNLTESHLSIHHLLNSE